MLSIAYEGWLECRLATDPDPADEPRGVSGWTFALAGEPDLDRVIRLQPVGTINRPLGPQIGVVVRAVSLFGEQMPEHPLLGAPVELLDEPVFEGRNGIAAENAREPILPFHLRIRQGGITVCRAHRDPSTGRDIAEPPISTDPPPEVRSAAGIASPREHRAQRKAGLQAALDAATVPVQKVALQKRIRDFDREGVADIALASLGYWLGYRIGMQGPWVEIRDERGTLGAAVDTSTWVTEFWVGAWDADVLCAYMKGRLDLPVRTA